MTNHAESGTSLGSWLLISLNMLFYLLLLDLAVETWLSQSPLRIWVALVVLLYLCVTLYLFIKRNETWKQITWGTRLVLSILVFVSITGLSVFHPAGLEQGAAFVGQQTDIALSVLVLSALVVTGIYTITWSKLPKSLSIAIAVVVLYGVAAFVLGIISRVPFADLFQVSSFLSNLPTWMQGAMIGAFVALPVCIVLSSIRLLTSRDMLGSVAKGFIVLLLAVTLLPSVAAVRNGSGQISIAVDKTHEDYGSEPVQIAKEAIPSDTASVSPKVDEDIVSVDNVPNSARVAEDMPPQDTDSSSTTKALELTRSELADKLEVAFSYLGRFYESMDRETIDPRAVVARIGKDPDAILEFVQTQTMFVPYIGSLKGSQGVLADRIGNSLDRSLLLQELLSVAGHQSRLARGQLSEEMLEGLADYSGKFPELVDRSVDPGFDEQDVLNDIGLDKEWLDAVSAKEKDATDATDAMKAAVDRIGAQADYLYRATGKEGDVVQDTIIHEALRDHWWVQVGSGSDWLDLDPSGIIQADVKRPLNMSHFDGKVPEELLHTVTIKVGITFADQGELKEEILLESVLLSRDYVGRTVRVLNLAKDSPAAASRSPVHDKETTWIPVLADSGRVLTDKIFSMTGKPRSVQELSMPSGHTDKVESVTDIFGSLPGGSPSIDPDDQNQIKLRSQWIDYEVYAPGRKVEKVRRMILDSGRDGSTNEEGIALALSTITDIAIQSADISALFQQAISVRSSLSYKDRILGLLRSSTQEEAAEFSKSLLSVAPNSMELLELAKLRNLQANPKSSMYLDRPNILSLHTGVRKAGKVQMIGFKAFDIVANKVAAYDRFKTRTARVFQGVRDTRAEFELSRMQAEIEGGTQLPNVAVLFRVSDADSWTVSTESTESSAFDSIGTIESEHRWIVKKDGTTLGVDSRNWGTATADYSVGLSVAVDISICLGVAYVTTTGDGEAAAKAAAMFATAALCAVAGGIGTAAGSIGGNTGMILGKVIPALMGLLPNVLGAMDESRPDAQGRWPETNSNSRSSSSSSEVGGAGTGSTESSGGTGRGADPIFDNPDLNGDSSSSGAGGGADSGGSSGGTSSSGASGDSSSRETEGDSESADSDPDECIGPCVTYIDDVPVNPDSFTEWHKPDEDQ